MCTSTVGYFQPYLETSTHSNPRHLFRNPKLKLRLQYTGSGLRHRSSGSTPSGQTGTTREELRNKVQDTTRARARPCSTNRVTSCRHASGSDCFSELGPSASAPCHSADRGSRFMCQLCRGCCGCCCCYGRLRFSAERLGKSASCCAAITPAGMQKQYYWPIPL